jgi:hypothetical protein
MKAPASPRPPTLLDALAPVAVLITLLSPTAQVDFAGLSG